VAVLASSATRPAASPAGAAPAVPAPEVGDLRDCELGTGLGKCARREIRMKDVGNNPPGTEVADSRQGQGIIADPPGERTPDQKAAAGRKGAFRRAGRGRGGGRVCAGGELLQ